MEGSIGGALLTAHLGLPELGTTQARGRGLDLEAAIGLALGEG